MRILIVDDSKAMRLIVRRHLRQAGFEGHDVDEAVSGKDALAKIKELRPQVVLSDWNMPEMTGIELLEALGKEGIKVLFGFVTSEGTPEMRQRASAAGAKFLIAKPFSPEDFETALKPLVHAA